MLELYCKEDRCVCQHLVQNLSTKNQINGKINYQSGNYYYSYIVTSVLIKRAKMYLSDD